MKYLVKNKIPDQTPYVSLNYNGDVNYAQISGSGLPSTIHAEEDGLYIEKNNKIWPMTHPDLSTQPSILPQRFGKLPIYEELIAVTNTINNSTLYRKTEYYNSQIFFDEFCIDLIKLSNLFRDLLYETVAEIQDVYIYYNTTSESYYLSTGGRDVTFHPSNIIICTRKGNVWNIFNKINYSQMKAGNYYDSAYLIYWGQHTSSGCTLYNKLIKVSINGVHNLKEDIISSTIFSDSPDYNYISDYFVRGRFIANNPYEDNLYIEDVQKIIDAEQPCIKINQSINRTNIIQASTFNETNYSPVTIENGIVTTKLNFKPDYLLVQYFGEMDDYYYYVNNIQSLHIFDWNSYKWCKGSYETLTKYCTNSSYGYEDFTDNKTELDSEDDAAYVNWGPKWRMPSKEQFEELINSSNTTTEWTTQNGVNGRKITSNTNGNYIFLPAAGARYDGTLTLAGQSGYYWSRALNSDIPHNARLLNFDSSGIIMTSSIRHGGLSVRPVCTDSSQTNHEYVDLGLPSGTLWATMNIGASSPEDYGLYFAWGETEGYQ